ncbi:MAG: TerC family protein [Ilumatobacteraceae bacterium]|jgi:tellurite resistance protein TerC|nr:TerC family protein [Ilumatobacteraceae bacterium]MDP5068650.1 TerC family protein [Ilumatobacteraceae bacterium]
MFFIGPVVAASTGSSSGKVDLTIEGWHWPVLLGVIGAMLLIDILVVHRNAHEIHTKEAAIESAVWISVGLLFGLVVLWEFGSAAAGEYMGGYLIEKSLSVDNVFVWAVLFTHFQVPKMYQHRVLFWGIFGALAMRVGFIFAGVAIINSFKITLILFGLFLLYSGIKLLQTHDEGFDPAKSKAMKIFHRFVPSTDELDGQKLWTRVNGKRLATPLLAVLVLVEITDVIFAVDSVPAVLAVTNEQYIAFASNAFAILGLRALYFLLADMRDRFQYLQTGLGVILAFVGIKMTLSYWWHMPIAASLSVIAMILAVSIVASLRSTSTTQS